MNSTKPQSAGTEKTASILKNLQPWFTTFATILAPLSFIVGFAYETGFFAGLGFDSTFGLRGILLTQLSIYDYIKSTAYVAANLMLIAMTMAIVITSIAAFWTTIKIPVNIVFCGSAMESSILAIFNFISKQLKKSTSILRTSLSSSEITQNHHIKEPRKIANHLTIIIQSIAILSYFFLFIEMIFPLSKGIFQLASPTNNSRLNSLVNILEWIIILLSITTGSVYLFLMIRPFLGYATSTPEKIDISSHIPKSTRPILKFSLILLVTLGIVDIAHDTGYREAYESKNHPKDRINISFNVDKAGEGKEQDAFLIRAYDKFSVIKTTGTEQIQFVMNDAVRMISMESGWGNRSFQRVVENDMCRSWHLTKSICFTTEETDIGSPAPNMGRR